MIIGDVPPIQTTYPVFEPLTTAGGRGDSGAGETTEPGEVAVGAQCWTAM